MPLSSVRLRAPILQPPTLRDFFVYEGHANSGGDKQTDLDTGRPVAISNNMTPHA